MGLFIADTIFRLVCGQKKEYKYIHTQAVCVCYVNRDLLYTCAGEKSIWPLVLFS
uniref:Uncharacterized protein n=1 Tax=Daphnia magna TaxID=35525 RepID=A0A0P5XKF3_9CRUS